MFSLGFILVSPCVIIKVVMTMDLQSLISLTGKKKSTIKQFLREQGLVYVKSKNIFNVYNETFFDVPGLSVSFKFRRHHCSAIIIHQSYEDEDSAKVAVQKLRTGLIEHLGVPTSDNHNHPSANLFVSWEKDSYIQLNQTEKLKRIYIYMTPKNQPKFKPDRIVWFISMIGGLCFGLAMFGFMGLSYGYDFLSFVINMVGGLVWGLLFGFFMNLSFNKNPTDPYKVNLTKRNRDWFETYRFGQTDIESEQPCLCAFQTKTGLQFFKTTIYFYDHKAVFAYLRRGKLYEMTLPYANINLYMDHQDNKEVVVWLNNKTKLIIRNSVGLPILTERLDNILGYQENAYLSLEKFILEVLKNYDLMGLMAGGASNSVFEYDARSIARYLYKERPLDEGDVEQVLITYFEGLPIDSFEGLAKRIFEFYQNP